MDIRSALKGQYHAALMMLRECVEKCPEELWISGTFPRNFWRIAYHAVFYSHLYLVQSEAVYLPWAKDREGAADLWAEAKPEVIEPYSRAEILSRIDEVNGMLDSTIDELDLDTADSGFPWYPSMGKLEHEILNIRHIQGHVGQLSELLMARDIDTGWIARPKCR